MSNGNNETIANFDLKDLEGIEKKSTPVYAFSEVGSTGLKRYGGTIYEEFLYALYMPACLKVYKEMSLNDATIGALLFIFDMLIRKTPWDVIPGGTKRVDKQIANFVFENMHDMSHSWEDLITEALSMLRYGWSWHEIVYKKRNGYNRNPDKSSKYNDGRIGWAKIPGRSQDTWNNWVFDEPDNPDRLIGMEQLAYTQPTAVIIPWEKSLLFRTTGERGNPEGRSILRNAYRSWYFKKHFEEIEGIGVERDLAGMPVIKVPEGVDIWNTNNSDAVALKTALEKLISNIRRDKNEGVILPAGYELELLSSSGSKSRSFDTTKIINRYDQRIAMSVLADILMLGTERTGSFALANIKKTLLASALEAQAQNIATIINKYAIPRLIRLNSFVNYTDFPKIVPGEIEAPDMVQLADAMERMTGMGFNFTNEKVAAYIYSCLGLPKPDNTKDMFAMQDKTGNKGNDGDKLPPRKYKDHQTDDKKPYNQIYESEGMK
ncbi:MAG: phage portal protein family protein [Candidatus Heimdallarchaeaceae archaeon]